MTSNEAITATVVEEVSKVEPLSEFETITKKLKETGTAAQLGLVRSLEQYLSDMKPGVPVSGVEGARLQYSFWKVISGLIETSPKEEFTVLWNILLMYFNEFQDSGFGDRYVYRFSEFWAWSESDLNAFQRVVNLLTLTRDPSKRAEGIKQVDLNRTLAVGFSEEAIQRLVGFYK